MAIQQRVGLLSERRAGSRPHRHPGLVPDRTSLTPARTETALGKSPRAVSATDASSAPRLLPLIDTLGAPFLPMRRFGVVLVELDGPARVAVAPVSVEE